MNTIPRPRIHHYHWLDWLQRPIYRFLAKRYKTYLEARYFTTATCPKCSEPAVSPSAVYCFRCGSSLIADDVPTIILSNPKITAHHTGEIDIKQIAINLTRLKRYPSVEEARADMQSRTGRIPALPQSVRPAQSAVRPARLTIKLAEKKEEKE